MRTSIARALLLVGALLGGCRGCDGGAQQVAPSARVVPTSLVFGKAKLGAPLRRSLSVYADSRAPVQVTGGRLEDLAEPGASAAFTVSGVPLTVPALGQAELQVDFTPSAVRSHDARLLLETNDPDRPTLEVILVGEGASPTLQLTPVCDPARRCRGTVAESPPSIDFGAEVFGRREPLPGSELPFVLLRNSGEVDLLVSALAVEGADAAAFSLAAQVLVDSGPGGQPARVLAPGAAVEVPLRFTPHSEGQSAYAAELVVRSDAPATPEVRVALRGQLRPNAPPNVCANLTRVTRGGETLEEASGEADWAPLRTAPPDDTYDFTATRTVLPALVDGSRQVTPTRVTLSALSPGGDAACTTDPEEGRQGLRYRWTLLEAPAGGTAPRLLTPDGAQTDVELGPQAGAYAVALEVADPQGGAPVRRTLRFAAVPREDLVVQLSWDGADGGFRDVDLDLHLVRPSTAALHGSGPFAGAFAWFDESAPGSGVLTSGDINGRARTEVQARPTEYGFDWGQPGPQADDPHLPYDDTGASLQLETLTLESPEADARCAAEACRYGVFVHYYRDARPPGTPLTCNGPGGPSDCRDGAQCECPAGYACVFAEAPAQGPATGEGKCYLAPQPVVRVFARGAVQPLAVIPAEGQRLLLGAPCQMAHVADVVWPAAPQGDGGAPRVEVQGLQADGGLTPVLKRFGRRQGGGLDCVGNVAEPGATAGTWYQAAE